MLCYVMLCYVMLCYVMLCYLMLCYLMLCYLMLCYFMLLMVRYVTLRYVTLCCGGVICHIYMIGSSVRVHVHFNSFVSLLNLQVLRKVLFLFCFVLFVCLFVCFCSVVVAVSVFNKINAYIFLFNLVQRLSNVIMDFQK